MVFILRAVLVVVAVLAALGDATQLEARADQRALLRSSIRNGLGWSVKKGVKDAGKGVTKTVGDVGKGVNDVVDDVGEGVNDAYKYTKKVSSDVYNSCSAEVHSAARSANALLTQGTKLARPISQAAWNDITSDVKNNWKKIVNAVGSIESYVENDLVSDLETIGKFIVNQLICTENGMAATAFACSIALSAAFCAATNGAAPGCLPESMTLLEKLAAIVGLAAMSLIFRCSYYHVLRQIPGICDGMAYGIGTQMGFAITADPYSMACNAATYCGCGACTFSCSYPGSEICKASTYKDAVKDLFNAIKDLI